MVFAFGSEFFATTVVPPPPAMPKAVAMKKPIRLRLVVVEGWETVTSFRHGRNLITLLISSRCGTSNTPPHPEVYSSRAWD